MGRSVPIGVSVLIVYISLLNIIVVFFCRGIVFNVPIGRSVPLKHSYQLGRSYLLGHSVPIGHNLPFSLKK